MNVALSVTPAAAAFFFESSTMSGLYSIPIARDAALGRGDHRPAVAGPEIHDEVGGRDLRHVEHLVHQRLRRRYPDDVLAALADLRFVRLRGCRDLGESRDAPQRNDQSEDERAG